jgi:hypothetical protein
MVAAAVVLDHQQPTADGELEFAHSAAFAAAFPFEIEEPVEFVRDLC